METTKSPLNVQKKYICVICDYKCSKLAEYNRHLLTRKHKEGNHLETPFPDTMDAKLICLCGKSYVNRSGLWKHKKTCSKIINKKNIEQVLDSNLLLELLKQNQEFKDLIIEQSSKMVEQNNKILELSQNTNSTQITNSNNNNTINNKFNLNFFLNEQCKDAMNIMDFANSLEIGLDELEAVGNLGYATGIGNIIVRGLKELDIYKRPIHCSDSKRENLHVKDQGVWEQDKDRNLVTTAIRRVAKKNMMKITDWKEANPEYTDYESKTSDTYMKLLIEATGPSTEDEKEKDFCKIIRKVAKEVAIEK